PVLIIAAVEGIGNAAHWAGAVARRWRGARLRRPSLALPEQATTKLSRSRLGTMLPLPFPRPGGKGAWSKAPPGEPSGSPAPAPPAVVTLTLAAALALSAAFTHYVSGAGPGSRAFQVVQPSTHDRLLARFLSEIPPNDE